MAQQDHAQVKTIPPLVPLATIVMGWLLDRYVYALPIPVSHPIQMIVANIAMLLASILLVGGLYFFAKTRQNPEPHSPTNELYTGGIYRWTRNPIYLGFVVAQIVVAVKLNNLYVLLLIPAVILLLNLWVIKPEEAYLSEKFGEPYLNYQQRVRRWI